MIIAAQGRCALRGRLSQTVAILASGLFVLSGIQILCGMTDGILWLMGMACAIFVMAGMLCGCLKAKSANIWFLAARAFIRAEWMAALEWQLDRYYVPDGMKDSLLYSGIFCLIFFSVAALIFYLTEMYFIRRERSFDCMDVSCQKAVGIWFYTLIFFAFSNLSYVEPDAPFAGTRMAEIFNIRALVDLAGIIMIEMLNMEALSITRKREEAAIQNVLHAQYQQYRQSQENMDLINRKYHDLKHQLQVIRAENDSGRRLEYLDEMEEGLNFFEAETHTGNAVLDTILTSKSRICVRRNIQMKVVADGKILNHLHVMDLATIFGNALDNAIEHEVQIEDPEKRMIRVSVSRRGMMACAVHAAVRAE